MNLFLSRRILWCKYIQAHGCFKRAGYKTDVAAVTTKHVINLSLDYVPARGLADRGRRKDFRYEDDHASFDPAKPRTQALYPGHVMLSPLQRATMAFQSAYLCVTDPARADMVAALGEVTGKRALKRLRKQMLADPIGAQILRDRPLINTKTWDLDHLSTLPEGSFGNSYLRFLQENHFSPDDRPPVKFIDDPDLHYVMTRYRQVHDLCHLMLEMPPNMQGEVVVKVFEGVQTGLPMCWITAAGWPFVRLGPKHRSKLFKLYLPWAVRIARNSSPLMNVYWERHWETNISVLKHQLGLEPPPEPLVRTGKGTIN